MNALSGYIELELGDQVLPFKFGSNAWALFCEMHKIEFFQIADSGVFGKVEEGEVVSPPNIERLRELYYCAYQSAMRSKGEKVTINMFAFNDLLDETKGAVLKLQEVMLTSRILGYTFVELAEEGKKKMNL